MAVERSPEAGSVGSQPIKISSPSLMPSPSESDNNGSVTTPLSRPLTSSPSPRPSPSVSAEFISVPSSYSSIFDRPSPSASSRASTGSLGFRSLFRSYSSGRPSPSESPLVTTTIRRLARTSSLRALIRTTPSATAVTLPVLSTTAVSELVDEKLTPGSLEASVSEEPSA